jgi:hypothetical protein
VFPEPPVIAIVPAPELLATESGAPTVPEGVPPLEQAKLANPSTMIKVVCLDRRTACVQHTAVRFELGISDHLPLRHPERIHACARR